MNLPDRKCLRVLSAPIDVINWDQALQKINQWAQLNESRYVCICNAHSVVTAGQDKQFHQVISAADMATPDGAPVAWMLALLGKNQQERINGPDLMWRYCEFIQESDESIYLFGASENTLQLLRLRLKTSFPRLNIAGSYSPPFRPLSDEEDAEIIRRINALVHRQFGLVLDAPSKKFGWPSKNH